MDDTTRIELEAAAFRKLVAHFQKRTDVQNIDLMNLAGFCRNCTSKWYHGAAQEKGLELSYDQAQQQIYGMPYADFKAGFQTPASTEQLEKFNAITPQQKTE